MALGEINVMVLLHHLTQFLAQANELQLPPGFEDQVRWLYKQFEVILGFLTHNNNNEDGTRLLVEEISKLAQEAEDIVDTYFSYINFAKHMRSISRADLFALAMELTAKFQKPQKDIEGIISRIGSDHGGDGDGNRFEYESARERGVEMLKQYLPPTRSWIADGEDDDHLLVNRSKFRERLVDRLINGKAEGGAVDVIVLLGVRGAGKTTLAKQVYNDVSIQFHFETRAWVLFSSYSDSLRNLLLAILSQIMVITEDMYDMDERELKLQLLKQLNGRRYLMVLDNVERNEIWNELQEAFPRNKVGGQALLTSFYPCSPGIEGHFVLQSTHEHHLLPYSESRNYGNFYLADFSEEERWEMFCKKIFGGKKCPKDLEDIGRRIVIGCGKWNLQVILAACHLKAGEQTVSRWSNFEAQRNRNPTLGYMRLSYYEIPQHLKPCFLYFSVLPLDGYEISVKQLINLWIAEGLIPWVENSTKRSMEDIAEDYLDALNGLNLIQVTKRRSNGGAKSCLPLRDLHFRSIKMSSKEQFLAVFNTTYVVLDPLAQSKLRRVSVHSNYEVLTLISPYNSLSSLVRSFSCFSKDTQMVSEKHWESLFKQLLWLRVLNIGGEQEIGKLPEAAIGQLFHLRYLRVKPARNISVPKSIFNLWNLQTIDLRTAQFRKIPKEIWEMQQLRHLYLGGQSRLPKTEGDEDCLPNLQTLSYISNDSNHDIHISEKAPNLRKLGLYGYQCYSRSEQDVTFNLPLLHTLKFAKGCTFDEPIILPTTITKITVRDSHLNPEVIKIFEKLPNLQILKLVQTYFDYDELVFGEGSFPQLRLLKFEDSNIATWQLKKGAMPNLHRLVISKCSVLTQPPAELKEINTLQELELFLTSMTFAKKLRDDVLKEKKGLKFKIDPPLVSTTT